MPQAYLPHKWEGSRLFPDGFFQLPDDGAQMGDGQPRAHYMKSVREDMPRKSYTPHIFGLGVIRGAGAHPGQFHRIVGYHIRFVSIELFLFSAVLAELINGIVGEGVPFRLFQFLFHLPFFSAVRAVSSASFFSFWPESSFPGCSSTSEGMGGGVTLAGWVFLPRIPEYP